MSYATAKLIKVDVIGKDENLNEITEKTETEVFVEERSVTCDEFYQASAQGLKPSVVLRLAYSMDYSGEELVEYDGKTYTVIRTFKSGSEDWIDLTLEEKRGKYGK